MWRDSHCWCLSSESDKDEETEAETVEVVRVKRSQ